jgi:hypothetical protein
LTALIEIRLVGSVKSLFGSAEFHGFFSILERSL